MEDPDSSLHIYIIFLFILILANAFFAMSEMAVVTLNDNKIRKMAAGGNPKARILMNLTEKPSDFLATIQVGVTLSGFLTSAVAADTFTGQIVDWVSNNGLEIPLTAVRIISLVIITFIISYFSLVLGELAPKRIAMKYSEPIALAVAAPLQVIYRLEKPFVALTAASTNLVLRLFNVDPNRQSDEVTEEEIRMMIDVGEESGHIEQSDKDMINNIFEFDDRAVGEMMNHRTEITGVEVGTNLEETVGIFRESGYSRLPVYEDDLDSIIGMLYVKDLLRFVAHDADNEFDLTQYMRKPFYVPESANGKALLKEFKDKKIHMAIVVDEYGGTSGLVTMEDLIESIVGDIQDEYDDEEDEISRLEENRYIVDGLTPLEEVAEFFNIALTEDDDFDTIGGYLVNRLGYIPEDEEYPTVTVGDVVLTVRGMDDRRIDKIEVERLHDQCDQRNAEPDTRLG